MSNIQSKGLADVNSIPKASFLEKAKLDHDRSTRIARDPMIRLSPNLQNRFLVQAGIMNLLLTRKSNHVIAR